jgi:hypothetical protein
MDKMIKKGTRQIKEVMRSRYNDQLVDYNKISGGVELKHENNLHVDTITHLFDV